MIRHLAWSAFAAAVLTVSTAEASWIFQTSYYSHSDEGIRVAQYSPGVIPWAPYAADYRQSAYRHNQTVLRDSAGSADRLHVVQTWGGGEYIRPYEEWERPFREGATPYGPWGNPQGPWTTPFGAWVNPYGLGQLPHPPWPHLPYVPYPVVPPATPAP
jgi:hypothetical protein